MFDEESFGENIITEENDEGGCNEGCGADSLRAPLGNKTSDIRQATVFLKANRVKMDEHAQKLDEIKRMQREQEALEQLALIRSLYQPKATAGQFSNDSRIAMPNKSARAHIKYKEGKFEKRIFLDINNRPEAADYPINQPMMAPDNQPEIKVPAD